MSQTKTFFASPERVDAQQLEKVYDSLRYNPLFCYLLDAMPDGIVVLNEHRQIVYANQRFVAITHTQANQLIGLRPGEAVHCEHADGAPGGCGTGLACRACGAVEAVLSSQKDHAPKMKTCSLKLQGGSSLDVTVHAHPLSIDGLQLTLVIICNAEHEARRRNLETAFFHDVLDTASGVQSGIDLLADENYTDVDRQITLMIQTNAHKLVGEIKSHRDLLSAERGELKIDPKPYRSTHLLQEALEAFSNNPTVRGRRVTLHPEVKVFVVETDPNLFGRVLGNMVRNAAEAEEPGATISLGCQAEAGTGTFWVHNPTPIPEEVQLQLFKRSFSTKGEGRGVGTYSMRLLGERYLGGKVSFSVDEWGTTFYIKVPLKLDDKKLSK